MQSTNHYSNLSKVETVFSSYLLGILQICVSELLGLLLQLFLLTTSAPREFQFHIPLCRDRLHNLPTFNSLQECL